MSVEVNIYMVSRHDFRGKSIKCDLLHHPHEKKSKIEWSLYRMPSSLLEHIFCRSIPRLRIHIKATIFYQTLRTFKAESTKFIPVRTGVMAIKKSVPRLGPFWLTLH